MAVILPLVLLTKGMSVISILLISLAIILGTTALFMMALCLSTLFKKAEMASTTSLVLFPCVGLTLYLVPTVFAKQQ